MGVADGPARTGARLAIHQSRTSPREFVRRTSVLDFVTDTNVATTQTVLLRTTPRLRYKTYQVDGNTVLRGDTYILVAALDVEEIGFDMTLDERDAPSASVTMIVQDASDDEHWNVKSIQVIESGDLIAAYKIQLRK